VDDDEVDAHEEYEHAAQLLTKMMDARDAHARSVPNCGAAPLCMGPIASINLAMILMTWPGMEAVLIMTAVGELSRMRRENAEAQAWKRDIVQQLERSTEDHEQERRELLAQLSSMRTVAADLQVELTKMRGGR
jgi:hypothetical protein